MNKINGFFKNFIKTRNVAFYVAFAFAVISFVFGLVSTLTLGMAGASAAAVGFTAAGLVLFILFALVGHEWIGAASSALASGGALVALVCECYSYFLDEVMDLSMTGISMSTIMSVDGMGAAIACLVGLLVCAVVENVFVYLRLKKKNESVSGGEEVAPEETAGQNNLTEDAK